jgi:type IV pilus assembly protein PilW
MICNTDYAIAFAATGVTSAGTTIGHSTASNCGAGFTPAPDSTKCAATSSGTGYCFWAGTAPTAADVTNCPAGIGTSPAFVTVPIQVTWTVESNSRGGNSLYRTVGANKSEIAEGVTGLDLTYKVGTAAGYVGAGAVTDWSRVTAVRVQMSFEAASGGALSATQVKGTDNNALTRSLDDYILLRNHQDIL